MRPYTIHYTLGGYDVSVEILAETLGQALERFAETGIPSDHGPAHAMPTVPFACPPSEPARESDLSRKCREMWLPIDCRGEGYPCRSPIQCRTCNPELD